MNGTKVKAIRYKAMLSQEEFAKEIMVSTRTVSQWELGKKRIRLSNQRKIVEFCKNHNIDIEKIKGE